MCLSAVLSRVFRNSRFFIPAAFFLALPLAAAAATEVGAIPGSFSVSPTGAATYSIPISLPPGIAGMAPHLALVYSSQSGNGLAGYGWTLSGLSSISVCDKTWAQDGVNQSVNFNGTTSNDYCLDGTKLKLINSFAVYHKELDDFTAIFPLGGQFAGPPGLGPVPTSGPHWFKVETRDGLTYEYGFTADSEIVAVGPGVSGTVVRTWALDSIYDKAGNAIHFTYQQDTGNGNYYPTQITYTVNGSSSGPNSVVFKYDVLSTISPALVRGSYFGGAFIGQTKRLNELDVDYNGTPTFAYYLGYNNTLTDSNGHPGTERSQLTSIQECAGSTKTNCYPTTNISWQNGISGWGNGTGQPMGGFAISDASHAAAIHLVDVDGDGRADVVYPGPTDWMVMFSNGSGFSAPVDTGVAAGTNYAQALVVSVGTSGQHGLLVPIGSDWYLLAPQFTNNLDNSTFIGFAASDTGTPATGAGGNATTADFNGDGLTDLAYSDGTNLNWLEGTSANPGFAGSQILAAGEFSSAKDGGVQYKSQFADITPDFDGSGRSGFMTLTVATTQCTPDYCPKPTPPPQFSWLVEEGGGYGQTPAYMGSVDNVDGDAIPPIFIDLNADGLTDLLYADGQSLIGSGWTWRTYLSTGAGLARTDTGVVWNNSAEDIPVDFTGNGRQSLLLTLSGDTRQNACPVHWGLVGYFGGTFTTWDSGSTSFTCDSGYAPGSIRAADVQGKGFTDLVWVENTASSGPYTGTIFVADHNGPYPDLVTNISNGFGQAYNVSYASLANGASYAMENLATSTQPVQTILAGAGQPQQVAIPVGRNFKGAMYVVQNYQANDGVGGTFTDNFTYAGAVIDALGRGFLGFSETTASDSRHHAAGDAAGSFTDTTYNQFFPLTGTPTSATTWTNSAAKNTGNIKSNVQDTYANTLTTNSGTQYVYLQNAVSSDYELGAGSTTAASSYRSAATTTTPTFDGNNILSGMTVVTTLSPGSISSSTVTTFNLDENNWCLALPSSVAVTRTNNGTLSRTVSYVNDTAHCRETSESITQTLPSGETQTLSTAYTYDAFGHVSTKAITGTDSVTGSSTRTTTYCYDNPAVSGACTAVTGGTDEFVTSVTNPLGETVKQTWNAALGVVATATDPNGVQTSFGYDGFRLKTSELDGDGTTVSWCYGLASGDCGISKPTLANTAYWVIPTHSSNTGVAGATATMVYDMLGRPLQSSTNLLGGTLSNTQTTYDSLGRTLASSTPYSGSPTTWTYPIYDSFDRAMTTNSPAGQNSGCSVSYQSETVCQTSYAFNGLTTSVTDPKGNKTTSASDALGETLSVTDANSGLTSYNYDAFGDLVKVTDAALHVTTLSYDSWGHKTQMADPNMGTWTYGYDTFGELTSQKDAKNQTITLSYDALGRLHTKTVPGQSGTNTWTYDGPGGTPTVPFIGKLYSLQSADGSFSRAYQYDSAGRPSEVDATISGTTYATNTSYDTFGRVASVTYPAGPTPLSDDPPVAVASASANTGTVGQTITLNGTSSYDPDNGPHALTYSWTQTSAPPNSGTPLSATTATVNFSNTVAGTYTFTLTVSDSVLTSSATVSVTLSPLAITGLHASTVDPYTGNLSLSWTNPTGAGSNYVEQSTNGGAFSLLSGTFANPAPITGLANGNYQFAVQTCANGACDAWSSPVSVTALRAPAVPAAPTASPNPTTSGNFTLNWIKPAGVVTLYAVYRSTDGTNYGPGTNVGNVTSWPTSESVNGTYWYKVAACNTAAACSSTASPAGTETVNLPVPPAPTISANPTLVNGSTQTTTVSWHSNGSPAPTYYVLYWSADNSSWSPFYSGAATSYVDTPTFGTYYTVQGCNTAGCGPTGNSVKVSIRGCPSCSQINPAPTASNGSVTTTAGTAVSGTLSASGSGTLTFAIVTKPGHGTATITNAATGAFTYTPKNGFTGSDSFTFTASNSSGTSSAATESVTVNAVAVIVVPSAERLAEATSPVSVGVQDASVVDDVQARLATLRERALAREQATIIRRQRERESGDHYLDTRPKGDVLFAARMEPASEGAAPQTPERALSGAPLLSVQDAVVAGVIQSTDLTPKRLVVSGSSRFTVNYIYDSHENLSQVVNAANSSLIYWQGTATDVFGHVTTEILGNGIVTGRVYDPATGALQGEQSGVGSGAGVANRVFTWDADGNLNSRQDVNANLTESFNYDPLNRLHAATVSGAATSSLTMGYDPVGNISSKVQTGTSAGNMGTYSYDPNHPMQLTSVSGQAGTFTYDDSNGNAGDGNLLSDGTRSYTWDAENRPTQIADSATTASTTFNYTPDGARYFESSTGTGAYTLTEASGLFEVYGLGGHSYYRNMIQAPTGTVAIYTVRDDSQVTTRYLTTDHLGSSSEVTNEVGAVTEAMSYDSFGARRDPHTWLPYAVGASPTLTDVTDKGYTGQQELDPVGLIHMNGRVYDPAIGRMISADPATSPNAYSQGLSRYAYVQNNPLARTDPSGFWCHDDNGTEACEQDSGGDAGYQSGAELPDGTHTGDPGADSPGGGRGRIDGTQTGTSKGADAGGGTGHVTLDTVLSPDPGGTISGYFRYIARNGSAAGGTFNSGWQCVMDCGGAPTDWPIAGPSFGGGGEHGDGPDGGKDNNKNPRPQAPQSRTPNTRACSGSLGSFACQACINQTLNNAYGTFGGFIASTFNVQETVPGLSGDSLSSTLKLDGEIGLAKLLTAKAAQTGGNTVALGSETTAGFWSGTTLELAGEMAPEVLAGIGVVTTPFATTAMIEARSSCGG